MQTAEINYIFGNMGPNESFSYIPPLSAATSGDMKMSETIRSYWTNSLKLVIRMTQREVFHISPAIPATEIVSL
ncbi:hypothetical protein J3F84DRAFT_384002, partial [Trichoderma pleuroticola]